MPGNMREMPNRREFEPAGPVTGHDRIKNCSSLPDLIGRYLLLPYCGREDVAHVRANA